jgi:hypothetical protein
VSARQRLAIPGLVILPLVLIVVPTVLFRPLTPPGMRTMWPAMAVLMALGALTILPVAVHEWTRSTVNAVLATVASICVTLFGLMVLLFSAATGTSFG